MKIEKADIRYLSTGRGLLNEEGAVHRKSLPFHSIVQAVEGNYEVGLGNSPMFRAPEGGFFVAPPFAEQHIVHHLSENGRMQMRWIFFEAQINERPMNEQLSLPLILPPEAQKALGTLSDRMFSETDICLRMACMYEILHLLLTTSHPCDTGDENMLVNRLKAYLEISYSDPDLDVECLCARFFLSRASVYRLFSEKLGAPPHAYLHRIRLERAAFLLATTEKTVTKISEEIGFKDFCYFSKLFKKQFGMPPGEYRKIASRYLPGSV